jgi:hypothetical protein
MPAIYQITAFYIFQEYGVEAEYIREPCRGFAFDRSTTLTSGCSVSLLLNAL